MSIMHRKFGKPLLSSLNMYLENSVVVSKLLATLIYLTLSSLTQDLALFSYLSIYLSIYIFFLFLKHFCQNPQGQSRLRLYKNGGQNNKGKNKMQ